ncbi:CocE/NonD family hydrolase [Halosimplex pelagicum]|uniref:Xaa-Pro dipeptidyl-peptidase n=1 Tax=Halosimplex pelagicum TaxID=869886 RepID=A0A7D5T7P8_9EURY|nr:CocE/NonD family hydrolase [Halosimplex pelagicum]QLH80430.1 X-prolyl-dipeptidyl aminopeptidase [Halosimplex pelagicum]
MTDQSNASDGEGVTGAAPTGSVSRRRLLASVTTAVGTSAVAGRAYATPVGDKGGTADAGGAIREEAWVETGVDTDGDGTPDRIHVRVSYPEGATDGERPPVIAVASPYHGEQTHGDATAAMYYDRSIAPAPDGASGADGDATTATSEPATLGDPSAAGGPGPAHSPIGGPATAHRRAERRYIPQGYALARVSSLGTARSTGCYTAAGPPTVSALESVVDWFNGRATAYDAPEGGEEVAADWTNGRTGMIGASALGELANGTATTGVDGLETIVPQSANVGQYGLFRSNGTPISVTPDASEGMTDIGTWIQASNARRDDCGHWTERAEAGQDLATGDYNDFWHDRTYLADADAVDCSVLIAHAVDDPIVKPNNAADWYETLAAHDVPLKLWLYEGGHRGPAGEAWERTLDRWWAYWLQDEDTGVMDEDPVTVVHGGQSAAEGSAETFAEWPVPAAEPATVRFGAGGATSGAATTGEPGSGTESLVDDPSTPAADLVAAEESPHRLRYETPPLAEPVHVSGRVVPSLSLSLAEPTVVSVALVEYGDYSADIVTRGWVDPLNRPAYRDHDTPLAYRQSLRESAPLPDDGRVRAEFPLQATDHVFEADSRIGLVVYGSDSEFTLHPPGNREVALSLADSAVDLPVAGGESALAGAFADEPTDTARPTGTATATDSSTGTTASAEPTTDSPTATAGRPAGTTDGPVESTVVAEGDAAVDGTSSGDGPGFGVGGALAAIGGLGGLLRRGSDGED